MIGCAMKTITTRNELQEAVDWLKEHFPKAFPRTAKKVRPLQLGIMDDILDFYDRLDTAPFSKKKLRSGLNFYTSSKAYLQAQSAGAMRVDLFGFDVEAVTAEQAAYSLEKLASRYKQAKKVEEASETKVAEPKLVAEIPDKETVTEVTPPE